MTRRRRYQRPVPARRRLRRELDALVNVLDALELLWHVVTLPFRLVLWFFRDLP